eukprot:4319952-Lingulodinium_polyedra.AAC.1
MSSSIAPVADAPAQSRGLSCRRAPGHCCLCLCSAALHSQASGPACSEVEQVVHMDLPQSSA